MIVIDNNIAPFYDKGKSKRLKALLIIIMFWGHMFNHEDRLWNGVEWFSLFSIGGEKIEILLCPFFHVSVPLFFFISGYGFYLKYNKELSLGKLKNQVLKLYEKYWIVFFIAIPICFAAGILEFRPFEFALNFIGLSSSYCGEWWFLSTYLELVVLFWLVKFILQKQKINPKSNIAIMIVSIVVATGGYGLQFLLGRMGFNTENLVWNEVYYILIKQPLFVMGYVSVRTKLFDKAASVWNNRNKVSKIFCVGILILTIIFMPYISAVPETYLYVIYLPIFTFGFCLVDRFVPRIVKSFFTWMSKYSTYMWLCHSILLYKFAQRIIYFPKWSVLCWLVLIILTLVCSIGLSVLQMFIDNTAKILCGRNRNERL